jgi:hypothetical protein
MLSTHTFGNGRKRRFGSGAVTAARRPWFALAPAGLAALLPGHTVFSIDDAREAARRFLLFGPIRLKKPLASGGKAQNVARRINEVERYLAGIPLQELSQYGLVLEINPFPLATISVGEVTVGRFTTAYYGTQRRVKDNHGRLIYGGSMVAPILLAYAEAGANSKAFNCLLRRGSP